MCYKVMQVFMVTDLFAGQHNTKLHGTIKDVILIVHASDGATVNLSIYTLSFVFLLFPLNSLYFPYTLFISLYLRVEFII